jgi:mevalonate kinase
LITVQIPGKVMLAGEYAILHGGECIACTVDRFMTISIDKAEQDEFILASNMWREPLSVVPGVFQNQNNDLFADTVLHAHHRLGLKGAKITIDSALDCSFGIGSSSALRLGVLLGLKALAKHERQETAELSDAEKWQAAREACLLQRKQQQQASGYDIATQLLGGLVKMKPVPGAWPGRVATQPVQADRLGALLQIWVGGKGNKTAAMVPMVHSWLDENRLVPDLMEVNSRLVAAFSRALSDQREAQDESLLIQAACAQRQLFERSPGFPTALFDKFKTIPGFDSLFTVKTTGAGGEDALLIVGDKRHTFEARTLLTSLGWYPLEARFTQAGTHLQFT